MARADVITEESDVSVSIDEDELVTPYKDNCKLTSDDEIIVVFNADTDTAVI